MKVIIRVEGGIVQEVLCNGENVSVEVFDFDT